MFKAKVPSQPIQVHWKPFMIDPDTNINGETVRDYCQRRWGGAGWTDNLKQQGRKDGAQFGGWKWWPHTLTAHQLVHYCATNHLSTDKCNALLFDAEYEQNQNLAEVDVLVRVAEQMGIDDLDTVRSYLTDDQGSSEVQQEIQNGRRKFGIKGVPFFVICSESTPRPYGFSGAQTADTFLEIFDELCS